jgi:hypothetical protein
MQAPAVAEPTVKRVAYLDPTGHAHTADRQMSHRLKDIKGRVAALLDNGNDTSSFSLAVGLKPSRNNMV